MLSHPPKIKISGKKLWKNRNGTFAVVHYFI